MARLCISKYKKYPYIKFNWFHGVESSSLGFNRTMIARLPKFEVDEFNEKYPNYAIKYTEPDDNFGHVLIAIHIASPRDTVLIGTITTIKDNATISSNYTSHITEGLTWSQLDDLDSIFTAKRTGGKSLSVWRTDDGTLYVHRLEFMYHSDTITRHISRNRNRRPFGFAYRTEIGSDKKMDNKPFVEYNYRAILGSEEVILHNLPIFRTNLEGRAEMYNAEGNRWVMLKVPGDVLATMGRKEKEIINAVAKPVQNSDDKYIRVKFPAQIKDGCVRSPFLQVAATGKYDSGTHTKKLTYDVSYILNNGNGAIVDSLLRSAVATSIGARLVKVNTCRGVIPILYLTSIDLVNVPDFRTEVDWVVDKISSNDYPFDVDESVIKYSVNDVLVGFNNKKYDNHMLQEEKKVMPKNFEKVVVSGPATIAWINGEKIMVKKSEEDPYDYEKAMLALMVKSFFGDEARFHRWCRDNMKLINKAVEKDAKISASKTSKKHPKAEEKPTHKPNRHDRWTRKELDFLLANYKNMTNKAIGEALGRSYASVQTQLFRLHLKR